MPETHTNSKKRKRAPSPRGIPIKLSQQVYGPVKPTLVSYPSVHAPAATPFQCYTRKKSKIHHDPINKLASGDDDSTPKDQDIFLVGETDSMEFVTNEEESKNVASAGCRYLMAVFDRAKGEISILPEPQTPHILKQTVKALKSITPMAAPSTTQYKEARTALGETFGTKKAKAAIRAQERNQVDIGAMAGVMDYVMEGIDKGAKGLMTQEQAKAIADSSRLIPPYSATATEPEDIYPLHGIIPETEWKALSVSSFDEASSDKQRIALLPYRHSSWVNSHLKALTNVTGKGKRKSMRILLYISTMLSFRQAVSFKEMGKDELYEKLPSVPPMIVDGLLARFTEVARDSSKYQATPAKKTSLLTHLFALCLKLDNFALTPAPLANDLRMMTTEVNQLLKSLGCKIMKLDEREQQRLMVNDKSAKKAVLRAPVEFPKPKLKRKI